MKYKITIKHKPDGTHYYRGYVEMAFIGCWNGLYYCTIYQSPEKVWRDTYKEAAEYIESVIY